MSPSTRPQHLENMFPFADDHPARPGQRINLDQHLPSPLSHPYSPQVSLPFDPSSLTPEQLQNICSWIIDGPRSSCTILASTRKARSVLTALPGRRWMADIVSPPVHMGPSASSPADFASRNATFAATSASPTQLGALGQFQVVAQHIIRKAPRSPLRRTPAPCVGADALAIRLPSAPTSVPTLVNRVQPAKVSTIVAPAVVSVRPSTQSADALPTHHANLQSVAGNQAALSHLDQHPSSVARPAQVPKPDIIASATSTQRRKCQLDRLVAPQVVRTQDRDTRQPPTPARAQAAPSPNHDDADSDSTQTDDCDGVGVYVIDQVCAVSITVKRKTIELWYLIKWAGYGWDECTWELEDDSRMWHDTVHEFDTLAEKTTGVNVRARTN